VAAQEPGFAELTFRLGPLGGTVELLARAAPPRLLLAVSETPPDDVPLPAFERSPEARVTPRAVRVVVLDPGHGGSDPGVISASGLPEKDITLAVALRAKERLEEAQGLRVVLTREQDTFLAPEARAEIANRERPDVFVSIHCNGWFDPGLRGFSVGVPRSEEPDAASELPRWGTRTVRDRRDTETLAEILLREMGERLPIPDRGVRAAAYAELEGAAAPAVHVECGFLSNREDASRLVDPEFQATLGVAIAEGVGAYRHALASGEVDSP
jgi:N-acetylmuramoyl-L-alanine amidase